MKSLSYTLNTTQETSTATISTVSQAVTGSTEVTFLLSGIDQSHSSVDKIIVTIREISEIKELVFNRNLSPSTDSKSLSSTTFKHIVENSLLDGDREYRVDVAMHRDDGITDLYTIEFERYRSQLNDYLDVNLIKTDFVDTDTSQDNLLLTFEADDPSLVGTSLLSSNVDDYFYYASGNTSTGTCSTEVGFEDEYDFVQSALSHATFNVAADGCADGGFKLKFRTRTGIGTASFPGVGFFNPALPNSQFIHVTGFLNFHPLEDTRVKDINVPLVDIEGSNLKPGVTYKIENVSTGIGTSLSPLTGGYFFVDLYDVDGCETVTLGTSTLTAYITYDSV